MTIQAHSSSSANTGEAQSKKETRLLSPLHIQSIFYLACVCVYYKFSFLSFLFILIGLKQMEN